MDDLVGVFKEAGPFALVSVFFGAMGIVAALAALGLTAMTKPVAAQVLGLVCVLLALLILGSGLAGHALGVSATEASVRNVPDSMQDALLRKGNEEARANFTVALPLAGLPLAAGGLALAVSRSRRRAAGGRDR